MKVPFGDLQIQYSAIKVEIDAAIQSDIEETAFLKGRFVKEFEADFAEKNVVKHCIGVTNGTEAISEAL